MKTRRDLTTQRQSLAVALRLRLGADVEKLNGTSVSMLGGADLVTHTTTFGPSDRLQVALVSGLSFEVPILGETSTGCFGFRLGLEVSLNPPMKPAAKVDPER
jgi:hypothetical protein